MTIRAIVPELDDMDSNELMEFWVRYQSGRNSKELFPDKPKGARRACADLANYASNRATGITQRLAGNIETAQMYEGIAERIYKALPDFAKFN